MPPGTDGPISNAALKALRQYCSREDARPDLLATLEQHGLLWPVETPDHATLQARMFSAYAQASQSHVVDNFILGMEENRPDLRAGLSAYSFMQHFPRHDEVPHPSHACHVCGRQSNQTFDPTWLSTVTYVAGAVIAGGMDIITFVLEHQNRTPHRRPASTDTLVALLRLLHHDTAPDDTPTRLLKRVRSVPGLKVTVEQAGHLLEVLGHAGLLRTPEHAGLAQSFVNVGLVPSKSHSSNWSYPVDFWTGRHGIDAEALQHWFGGYPEVIGALEP
ncbi:hypothetical protein [Stenotrophomonas sp.]|uniref:hypothetical protein n=1 Tax=Stenotrophomonas sp. TaxID=69392 RepID=UPI002D705990|nr:hypothetical protein [Stenotrophomonas sp.]HYQ22193.1 hypothetical protein [Stenotrophomonas sp.]